MKKVVLSVILAVCFVMLLLPQGANAGTFAGTFCFKLADFSDVFIFNAETIGDLGFVTVSITGMNLIDDMGMSGGGSISGNNLTLSVTEAAYPGADLGRFHSIVIDLSSPDFSGTDDILTHQLDGSPSIITGEPLFLVSCQ